jgi:predicted 2-oxoglutarate/Fe(II)-dependent dioxygenase YbiX
MAPEQPGLGRGERATDFVLPLGPDNTRTRFYAKAGGEPTLLLFLGDDPSESIIQSLTSLAEHNTPVFAVHSGSAIPLDFPFPLFKDEKRAVITAYRLADEKRSILFILDPNLRILNTIILSDDVDIKSEVNTVLSEIDRKIDPIEIQTQAPVLVIPNVLDHQICEFLAQVWENQGNEETGVEQSHGSGREDTIDHQNKSRRDHVVKDEKLMRMLTGTIGRRVMPEIQRAFAYRATRFEGFKIACYDSASSGFFHAHRDNLSPSTAHRRFALTLNLNEGYVGGYLRFPEFGPHLYRPGTGGAVVFSCSHLHEVTAVTDSRRFTLLSFLFGEEGTQERK